MTKAIFDCFDVFIFRRFHVVKVLNEETEFHQERAEAERQKTLEMMELLEQESGDDVLGTWQQCPIRSVHDSDFQIVLLGT